MSNRVVVETSVSPALIDQLMGLYANRMVDEGKDKG